MEGLDTFIVFAATYRSVDEAEQDYKAVKDLYYKDHAVDTFDASVVKKDEQAGGRSIIDALVAGGFEKKNMQVTADRTSVDLQADNKEFSVKINGGCIIGQAGNVGFSVITASVLATGRCLIGKTRTIDW